MTGGDIDDFTLPAAPPPAVAGPPHFGDAPVAPPEKNDHTFVVDQAADLDTGCTFRGGGPLVFEIPVDRVVGDLQKLLDNGLISPTAQLEMPAFDVDFNGAPPPERDRVFFNGNVVPGEFLTGEDDTWKLNEFDVPTDWINFPSDASSPAMNTIQIDIDTLSSSERWCTSIDWASLTLEEIAPPTLFVHGILSNSAGWATPWQSGLDSLGIPNDAIDLGSDQGLLVLDSIAQNAQDIAARVDSLTMQWGVDRINIVSHSKGGLDSRHYIESSDKVNALIQMGTPNAGSPLANLIQQGAVGLTGLVGAAVVNALVGPAGIQLTTPFMAAYNLFHGSNPNTEYYSQAGDHRFGGIAGTVIDLVLLGIMGDRSDTIVPVSSVNALGFASQLSPIQSTGFSSTDAMHTSMVGSPIFFNALMDLATEPIPAVAPPPFPGAPIATGQQVGVVGQGATESFPIVVDGSGPLQFSLLHSSGMLDFRLISPTGFVIDPTVAGSNSDVDFQMSPASTGFSLSAYEVRGPRAETGEWTVEVTGATVDNPSGVEPFFVTAWAESTDITMEAALDKSFYHNGDDIIVTANLQNAGQPLTGATANVDIVLPDGQFTTVALVDDGSGQDATAADGIYTGLFSDTSQGGAYRMVVRSEGTAPVPFARSELLIATVTASNSTLTSNYTDQGVDTNGNGLFDELVVDAEFQVDEAATYRYVATLKDSSGADITQTSGQIDLTPGTQTIPLSFDGNTIFRHQMDGPYTVSVVRIAEEDPINLLPLQEEFDVHMTSAYSFLQFEHAAVTALGTGSDQGVDTNSNGLFDELEVNVDLLIESGDFYDWSARLEDATGNEIGFASGSGSLQAGTSPIPLVFDGALIGASGADGPYFVKDLFIFSNSASTNIPNAYETSAYAVEEFENAPVTSTPPVIESLTSDAEDCDDASVDGHVSVSGAFSNSDDTDTHTVMVDWGDGSSSAGSVDDQGGSGSFDETHHYANGGIYNVTVTLTDDDGEEVSSTTEVFVVGVGLADGVLSFVGSHGRDYIVAQPFRTDQLLVYANFVDGPVKHQFFSLADINEIRGMLCHGDDLAYLAAGVHLPAEIDGGAGNDSLFGGHANDILIGGPGFDHLLGNGGDDALDGGEGDDFLQGHAGNDLIDGGAGNNHLFGDAGNDALAAADGSDHLSGGQGNDEILAGGGLDFLFGGDGDDTLDSGAGHDFLYGQSGDDLLMARQGHDWLYGGDGNDELLGGDGNDWIFGEAGHDLLDGEAGMDWLFGGLGNDDLFGGSGNDWLLGELGDDLLDGEDDFDTLLGGLGVDTLLNGEINLE